MARSAAKRMTETFETIYVTTDHVSCDGENGSGHPRVYLDLTKFGKAYCPYCSKTFIRES